MVELIEYDEQPNQTQVNQVLDYRRRGWWTINLPAGSKNPGRNDWQRERLDEAAIRERFSVQQNVALLLGIQEQPTDPILIDVDLDTIEVIRAARLPLALPPTNAQFGRQGRGITHYLYRVETAPRTQTWKAAGMKLLEIRSKGHQTVIPPSMHESGSEIQWIGPTIDGRATIASSPGEPLLVDIERLRFSLDRIAALGLLAREWPETGSRHDAVLALAGGLARAGVPREEALSLISDLGYLTGDEQRETDRPITVGMTYDKWMNGDKHLQGWPTLETLLTGGNGKAVISAVRMWLGLTKSTFQLNDGIAERHDQGNADRYVALHQDELRYNRNSGQWVVWEGTCWRPAPDENTALALARAVGNQILGEIANMPNVEEQKKHFNFGQETNNIHRIRAMVAIAKTREEIGVTTEMFDRDPLDINFLNGVLNLERGDFRPHRQDDMLSKLAPVRYDPNAPSDPKWESFLDDVTNGDRDFRHYLQKAAGYSLTGLVEEEVLFMAHGPAATGKTTFLEALRAVMGDYATTVNPEAFLQGRSAGAGSARPDLAKLVGARFVTAVEVDEGRNIAAAVVKQITGGDQITARFLYQNEFSFTPMCKIWIATNHDPGIKANDTGMWRRIHILNFHHEIPEAQRDRKLKAYFKDMGVIGPSLVNWMIEGYQKWHSEGLVKPASVKKAIEDYRNLQDELADFFQENCRFTPGSVKYATSQEIRERYENWCRRTGTRQLADNVFSSRLKDKGAVTARLKGGTLRVYRGMELIPRNEIFNTDVHVEEGNEVAD